jgi:YesN/AraC family two-component response regulator
MKILIVDDEEYIANGISAIIKSNVDLPTSLQIAFEGQQAYKIALSFKPDLIITDIRMHTMNGLDLVKILKEEKLCSFFIIISGYDKFSYAQTAIRFGVIGYLLKPIDKQELISLITSVYLTLPQTYAMIKNRRLPELDYFTCELHSEDYPTSLKKAILYIEKNYMADISLQTLSDELMLHPNYISSLFGKYAGSNFKCMLEYIRIKKASELLLFEPDLTVSEISYLVGYNNERRLYDAFQKRLNCTPGDFRNTYANISQ